MEATILHTAGGRLDAEDRSVFKAFCSRIANQKGSSRVLLHLHGGLVDQSAAQAIAQRLSGHGENAYNAPEDWEQVYVVWRTGVFETLRENWTDLARNDRLYNVLLTRLISFLSDKIHSAAFGGRSAFAEKGLTPVEVERRLRSGSDAPFADVDEATSSPLAGSRRAEIDDRAEDDLETLLREDTDLEDAALDIEAHLARDSAATRETVGRGDASVGEASFRRLDARVRENLHVEATAAAARSVFAGEIVRRIIKHALAIGRRTLQRYRVGRDHGLQATVTEEIVRELYGDLIGSLVWGMMKGDASEHFDSGGFGVELGLALSPAGTTAPQIMVVAHSAGSIFASEMLLWAERAKISLMIDLVFLAPAVRTSLFSKALDASPGRIRRFRSFVMEDELERKDVLLGKGYGFIYPSSLLYLVSGLFEEHAAEGLADAPLVGMARFLSSDSHWLSDPGEGAALAKVQGFLAATPNRTVRAVASAGAGLNCAAKSHGGFDDDPATLASVIAMLSSPLA